MLSNISIQKVNFPVIEGSFKAKLITWRSTDKKMIESTLIDALTYYSGFDQGLMNQITLF